MHSLLVTAGEHLALECDLPWAAELIAEGAAGQLRNEKGREAQVHVRVEANREPFGTRGLELLARGSWRGEGMVVLENVCTTGFDLHLRCTGRLAEFTYRWRPPIRERAIALLLRSRFHLLTRAVLLQYPVLWWAGGRGRAPLHGSGLAIGGSSPFVTAQSGIGRSTLLLHELEAGARITSDNLAVGDGETVWGLVEPLRVRGAGGRRMPHGRSERSFAGSLQALKPDSLVVLRRGSANEPSLLPCDAVSAARSLAASTYMAGELRRYWGFAAALSAGTGFGAVHQPVEAVASAFAAGLPCFTLALGTRPAAHLSRLLEKEKVEAWA